MTDRKQRVSDSKGPLQLGGPETSSPQSIPRDLLPPTRPCFLSITLPILPSYREGDKWRWGLHLDEGDILEADTRKGERNNSLL
jgi:hypothetical protein